MTNPSIHALVQVINERGEVTGRWEFNPTTMDKLLPFVIALTNARQEDDVRMSIDIAFPRHTRN